MWFRSFTLYRFTQPVMPLLDDLDKGLEELPLANCLPHQESSFGFVPPLGQQADQLRVQSGRWSWICVGNQTRLLPAAVIKEETEQRVFLLEQEEARKISNKQKKQIKEDVIHDLLPKSFTRNNRTDLLIDVDAGWLMVNAATDKAADDAISTLRDVLPSLPLKPVITQTPPTEQLANWFAKPNTLPSGFALADQIELKHTDGSGSVIGGRNISLDDDDIKMWLHNGFKPSKLRLRWHDQAEMTIDHNLRLTSFKFLDAFFDETMDQEHEQDPVLAAKASLLMVGNVYQSVITSLLEGFGISNEVSDKAITTENPTEIEAAV